VPGKIRTIDVAGLLAALCAASPATATQDIALPKPPEPFNGKIGRIVAQSKPAWPAGVAAPAHAGTRPRIDDRPHHRRPPTASADGTAGTIRPIRLNIKMETL